MPEPGNRKRDRQTHREKSAQIVELRKFKNKRRWTSIRKKFAVTNNVLHGGTIALISLSIVLAAIGAVPIPLHTRFLLFALLATSIGFVLALWLSVLGDPRAQKTLRVLALTFVLDVVLSMLQALWS